MSEDKSKLFSAEYLETENNSIYVKKSHIINITDNKMDNEVLGAEFNELMNSLERQKELEKREENETER